MLKRKFLFLLAVLVSLSISVLAQKKPIVKKPLSFTDSIYLPVFLKEKSDTIKNVKIYYDSSGYLKYQIGYQIVTGYWSEKIKAYVDVPKDKIRHFLNNGTEVIKDIYFSSDYSKALIPQSLQPVKIPVTNRVIKK